MQYVCDRSGFLETLLDKINSDVSAQIRSSNIVVEGIIDIDAISKAQQDDEPRIDALALGLALSVGVATNGIIPAGGVRRRRLRHGEQD